MATLKAHGQTLYKYDTLTSRIAIMSDRHILRDTGSGWKLYRKLKAEVDPATFANNRKALHADKTRNPARREFQREFHRLVSFRSRSLAFATIELMPDDADGCHITLADDIGVHLDLSETCELCRLYLAMLKEAKE